MTAIVDTSVRLCAEAARRQLARLGQLRDWTSGIALGATVGCVAVLSLPFSPEVQAAVSTAMGASWLLAWTAALGVHRARLSWLARAEFLYVLAAQQRNGGHHADGAAYAAEATAITAAVGGR